MPRYFDSYHSEYGSWACSLHRWCMWHSLTAWSNTCQGVKLGWVVVNISASRNLVSATNPIEQYIMPSFVNSRTVYCFTTQGRSQINSLDSRFSSVQCALSADHSGVMILWSELVLALTSLLILLFLLLDRSFLWNGSKAWTFHLLFYAIFAMYTTVLSQFTNRRHRLFWGGHPSMY